VIATVLQDYCIGKNVASFATIRKSRNRQIDRIATACGVFPGRLRPLNAGFPEGARTFIFDSRCGISRAFENASVATALRVD
jgi:hypothetical protein